MDNYQEKMPPKDEASSNREVVEKLAKELDEKVKLSAPPDLHPLLIDHFVQNVMTFLNVKDLKSARLVCKLWSVEGGEQLLNKSYVSPKLNSTKLTEEELMEFLSLAKSSSATIKLFCGSLDIYFFLAWFPKSVEKVRELKYDTDTRSDLWRLANALEKLPNLKILDISGLSCKNFPMYRNSDLDQFYDKLESFEEIRFSFPFSSNIQHLMEHGKSLTIVSKIILDHPDVQTVDFLIAQDLEWPLTHVTLKFAEYGQQINWNSIRQFFIKYSNTLKHLEIEIPLTAFPVPPRTPWTDDWLIPVNFPVLETMIISGSSINVWSLLTIALQLPQLKKLVLASVPERFNQKVREWESHRLAREKKLQSLSIEQVVLNGTFSESSSVVLKGNLWPNLKCLNMSVDSFFGNRCDSAFLTPRLFSFWEGLEILEINIRSLLSSCELKLYQKLWMGAEMQLCFAGDAGIVKEADNSSTSTCCKLSGLKNLKCLTLRLPPKFLLDNVLIYDCLGFMTNLQSLRFNAKSVLSPKALDHLKEALGDIVLFVGED